MRGLYPFKDTLQIGDRLVEVTVMAPEGTNVHNVLELAETALRSVNHEITIGKVTVRVKPITG